jgi:signal transduction histidine kinase
VLRHAGCTEAAVDLAMAGASLRMRVSDNGRGFDPDRAGDGHGLLSMRDRARGLGGELKLCSSPGHGATVELTIPLDPRPASP